MAAQRQAGRARGAAAGAPGPSHPRGGRTEGGAPRRVEERRAGALAFPSLPTLTVAGTETLQPSFSQVREVYERLAPRYDRLLRLPSRLLGFEEGRRWLTSGADGAVLEIGVGTGLNLPHYPAGVRLTGIDLSEPMLEVARRRAAELGLDAGLQAADAMALPFADGSFDRVISSLTLCTIPDPVAAVREAWRVCRGELRCFEHGVAGPLAARGVQRLLEPLSIRFEADRLTLDPREVFTKAGVPVSEITRTRLGICWRVRAMRESV